jgi:hypothetical protein
MYSASPSQFDIADTITASLLLSIFLYKLNPDRVKNGIQLIMISHNIYISGKLMYNIQLEHTTRICLALWALSLASLQCAK